VQKLQKKPSKPGQTEPPEDVLMFAIVPFFLSDSHLHSYDEFHPFLPKQHDGRPFLSFTTFNDAVDAFFSKLEGQKLDMQALQQVGRLIFPTSSLSEHQGAIGAEEAAKLQRNTRKAASGAASQGGEH
jgi:hypothetical protein